MLRERRKYRKYRGGESAEGVRVLVKKSQNLNVKCPLCNTSARILASSTSDGS